MIGAGIGRLLVASLHQAIADLLPTRLEFYEAWLNPTGLRDGRIGPAPPGGGRRFFLPRRWARAPGPRGGAAGVAAWGGGVVFPPAGGGAVPARLRARGRVHGRMVG